MRMTSICEIRIAAIIDPSINQNVPSKDGWIAGFGRQPKFGHPTSEHPIYVLWVSELAGENLRRSFSAMRRFSRFFAACSRLVFVGLFSE